MLSIIDKYIVRTFLTYFFSGLFIFIALFFVTDFISKFSRYDTTVSTLFKFYGYYLPEIVYQMLPVAVLLASILTISSLSRSNELIAFFSSGVSIYRICTPMIILVCMLCGLSFFLGDKVIPHFAKQKEIIKIKEIKKRAYKMRQFTGIKNNVWYRSGDLLVNLDSMDLTSNIGLGISLFYFSEKWELNKVVKASKAKLGSGSWELFDVKETLFSSESSFPMRYAYLSKVIEMNKKLSDLKVEELAVESMNVKQLNDFINRNKKSGLNTSSYEVDYHSKFSFSTAALLLVLMSIPFGVSKRRSGGGLASIGICLGIVLGFWLFYSFSLNLGKSGVLYPVVAAWLPNFIIFLIACFMLRRVNT